MEYTSSGRYRESGVCAKFGYTTNNQNEQQQQQQRRDPCDCTNRANMDQPAVMRPLSFEIVFTQISYQHHDTLHTMNEEYFKCKKKQQQFGTSSSRSIFLALLLAIVSFIIFADLFQLRHTLIVNHHQHHHEKNINQANKLIHHFLLAHFLQSSPSPIGMSIMVEAAETHHHHHYHHHPHDHHQNEKRSESASSYQHQHHRHHQDSTTNYTITDLDTWLSQQVPALAPELAPPLAPSPITTTTTDDIQQQQQQHFVSSDDDTSPVVVVNSGVNSYVSASPILAEPHHRNHNHQRHQQHAHHHHLRPPPPSTISSNELMSSLSDDIQMSNNLPEGGEPSSQEPFQRHISDKKPFAPQQFKRSYVHDGSTERENDRTQMDDTVERDNLPAEMFITSPFGAKLNSLRSKFSMNPATIIQTRESLALGATFLNHTYVKDFNGCLHDCWQTPDCDTAIYQETPAPSSPTTTSTTTSSTSTTTTTTTTTSSSVDFDQHRDDSKNDYVCYLFSCVREAKLICKFTSHNYYVSSFLKHHRVRISEEQQRINENRAWSHDRDRPHGGTSYKTKVVQHHSLSKQEMELHELRRSSAGAQRRSNSHTSEGPSRIVSHKLPDSNQLSQLVQSDEEWDKTQSNGDCHPHQFKCRSNDECIAIYNVCDGINQCADGSDEKFCPASTTEPTITVDEAYVQSRKNRQNNNRANDHSNKDSYNYFDSDATRQHSMLLPKDQQFDYGFRREDNFMPNIIGELKRPTATEFAQNSLDSSDGLGSEGSYGPGEPNLGIEGFFDKDSGRFITYHDDSSNPFYSVDSNRNGDALSGVNDLSFASQNPKTVGQEKLAKGVQFDALSSFRYKQPKTFLVPISNNKLEHNGKDMNDIRHWQHINSKQLTRIADNQKAPTYGGNFDPLEDTNPGKLDELGNISDDGENVQSRQTAITNQKDWNSARPVVHHADTSKPESSSGAGSATRGGHHEQQPIVYNQMRNGRLHSDKQDYWHDTHIASITIGQEEYDDFNARGTHSALIAFMFGIAITGMLIVIVALKMKSIREKLVRRGRRRSLVHEADFLINGMYL